MTFITAYVLAGIAIALAVMMQFRRRDPNWREVYILIVACLLGPVFVAIIIAAIICAAVIYVVTFAIGAVSIWASTKLGRIRFVR